MSMVSPPARRDEERLPNIIAAPIHEAATCVRAWGRRGIFLGANFGFVLGAIFVAVSYTADAPTFGVLGTVLVGMVECAVIAGAFAALAAARYSKTRNSAVPFERVRGANRRATHPVASDFWLRAPAPKFDLNSAYPLQDVHLQLGSLEAWENGTAGP